MEKLSVCFFIEDKAVLLSLEEILPNLHNGRIGRQLLNTSREINFPVFEKNNKYFIDNSRNILMQFSNENQQRFISLQHGELFSTIEQGESYQFLILSHSYLSVKMKKVILPVNGTITLGRSEQSNIVIDLNDNISRCHARIHIISNEELQGYTAVMDALKKAGSVRAASDAVLTGYEKPADQSETVKKKRAEYGEGYYKKYAAGNSTKYYRVRKSWTDAASQLGAFTSLENAKSACKAGYTVYDDNGKAVYTAAGQQASAGVPFSVQVDILDLNIRTGAGTNYAKTGETTGKGVFTIVEVKAGQGASAGWGRLKSGAGWISLDYATRLA